MSATRPMTPTLTPIPMPALAPTDSCEVFPVPTVPGVEVADADADVDVDNDDADVVVDVDVDAVDVDVDAVVVVDPASHMVIRSEGAAPTKVSFVGD